MAVTPKSGSYIKIKVSTVTQLYQNNTNNSKIHRHKKSPSSEGLSLSGGSGRNRTVDTRIFSPLLYQSRVTYAAPRLVTGAPIYVYR